MPSKKENSGKPSSSIPKPFNAGKWSTAKMRSFVMSALRRAQWPAKYASIASAFIANGTNPKTGKPCKLHRCPECNGIFPKGKMHADHIEPVIPLENETKTLTAWLGYDWNVVMRRLWCEKEGFRAICKDCHKAKTKEENKQRREYVKNQKR